MEALGDKHILKEGTRDACALHWSNVVKNISEEGVSSEHWCAMHILNNHVDEWDTPSAATDLYSLTFLFIIIYHFIPFCLYFSLILTDWSGEETVVSLWLLDLFLIIAFQWWLISVWFKAAYNYIRFVKSLVSRVNV